MKSQWMVRNKFRSTFLIIFAGSILALFGCSVIGKTVPVEDRIRLVSNGIQKGEQVVGDVIITYTYRLAQKTSDLSGLLQIDGNAQMKKQFRAYFLNVWINFLDSEGKILERKSLVRSYGVYREKFQEKFEAPAGTAGISFGANVRSSSGYVPSRI